MVEPSASSESQGARHWRKSNQEEQELKEAKSLFTWDLWKRRLATWPADCRGVEGSPCPIGIEVLSFPDLRASWPRSGVNRPRPPVQQGLVLHPSGFPGALSKGGKRGGGWGCLKIKVATDPPFPLVNGIFRLHPHHLRLYTWTFSPAPEEVGVFCSSPKQVRVGKRYIFKENYIE